jgi:DNA polymerase III beta subunit, central domain
VADAVLIRELRLLMPLADVSRYLAAAPGDRRALLDGHLDRLERRLADALTCVVVEGRDGSVRRAATDRYRLAVRDIAASGGPGGFRGLVPAATLARWRSEIPPAGTVTVGIREGHVVVTGAGVDCGRRT